MEKVGPGIKEFHALLSLNHIATIATSGKILKSYHISFKLTNNCRKLLTKLRFFLALLFGKLHDEWWLEAYRLSQKQWTLSSRTYKPPEKQSSIFLLMLKEHFKKEVNHCFHTTNWPLPFKKRFQDYSLILNERSMALLEGLLIFFHETLKT